MEGDSPGQQFRQDLLCLSLFCRAEQICVHIRQPERGLYSLPTLPGMIDQISRAVDSKRFSMEDIGKLISRDQVLTAKILKLANSAFFGFSRKVGSLTQALVLLGFDVVKGLILTSSV